MKKRNCFNGVLTGDHHLFGNQLSYFLLYVNRERRSYVFGRSLIPIWILLRLVATGLLGLGTVNFANARSSTAGNAGHLEIRILDETTGEQTPARVQLVKIDGDAVGPPESAIAIMYGRNDRFDGYSAQPDGGFYVDGSFTITLEPGIYTINISKGIEFLEQSHALAIEKAQSYNYEFTLQRWVNMPELGWYSADDHIHIRRSPREDPLIMRWIAAEDVHVGVLLQMGDFQATYYTQYAFGENGVYSEGDHILTSGQEDPRTHELGHTITFGAEKQMRYRGQYFLYDQVFDKIHEFGGLAGYAHQGMTFEGRRGMTLDVLSGKVDFLELLQFCVPGGPLHTDHYYHYLDLGFQLTATAGSDFPWCGISAVRWGPEYPPANPRIGNVRFYTKVDSDFTHRNWLESVRAGNTFVTSGPMLFLEVNGVGPGEKLDVMEGTEISVKAIALGHKGQIPLQDLQIIVHGKPVAALNVSEETNGNSKEKLVLEHAIKAEHGFWISAQVRAGRYQIAHTTPVYVTVDGGGFHNPETVSYYLDLNERYLDEIEVSISEPAERYDRMAWRYKEPLKARVLDVRSKIESMRLELESASNH